MNGVRVFMCSMNMRPDFMYYIILLEYCFLRSTYVGVVLSTFPVGLGEVYLFILLFELCDMIAKSFTVRVELFGVFIVLVELFFLNVV